MGFFEDWEKIMESANDDVVDWVKTKVSEHIERFLNDRATKRDLETLIDKCDSLLLDQYGQKTYYDSLERYVHNGRIRHDICGDFITSGFYSTLISVFVYCDDRCRGEGNFTDYHLYKMQVIFPTDEFENNDVKRFFLHCYNTFKEKFATPSSEDRAIVNAANEATANEAYITRQEIRDENRRTRDMIERNFNEMRNQDNGGKGESTVLQESPETKIHDDNDEYQKLYQDTLFWENLLEDDKKATLRNTYVKPCIKPQNGSYGFNLKKWVQDKDSRILLLYGKAGIGKTSLVSRFALGNRLNPIYHILKLRKYTDKLNSSDSWKSIKECFKYEDDNAYEGSILILDGLDEVCVLNQEFDGSKFVENLSRTLGTDFGRSIRVIITSRMGYFNEDRFNRYVELATVQWEESSVNKWCDRYCRTHENRKEWSVSFKGVYKDLDEDDKRRDVFCSPIILYICCVSQIDISKHNSVASIYDEAFRVIGKKEYHVMNEETEKEVEINRQFTKELAFQMFLNDKLEDALGADWVSIAREKTIQWGQKRYNAENINLEFKKIFALNHFAFNKSDAVEFAHKTVGEYFVSVKIYEDFFKHILEKTPKSIWHNIFNAFRYKKIPVDIMKYLVDLITSGQNDSWKSKFFKIYYTGIEQQLMITSANEKSEYVVFHASLLKQFPIAFRNLTWLLTGLGFDNSEFSNTEKNLEILVSYIKGDVNLSGWKNLNNIDFSMLDLKNSNFSNACLEGANFNETDLERASFDGANLDNSSFKNAYLEYASFVGTHLVNAHLEQANIKYATLADVRCDESRFENADLTLSYIKDAWFSGAQFNGAHLEGAYLSNVHFEEACFIGAFLNESVLRGVYLAKSDLHGVEIKNILFDGVHLECADLSLAFFYDIKPTEIKHAYLLESDLIKYDYLIHLGKMVFVEPIVATDDNRKTYNPETNRMEIKEE